MEPTVSDRDTDAISRVERFLADDDGGLLRRWAVDGFRRRLPHAVEAEGLEVGSVSRSDAGRIESMIVGAILTMIPYARIPRCRTAEA